MPIRRQLINLGSRNTDYRVGPGALDELDRFVASAVGTPKRAVLVTQLAADDALAVLARRALVDAGFSVTDATLPAQEDVSTLARATEVLAGFGRAGITADDLVVGLGDASLCGLAAFCARVWLEGTACVLLPTTLDAMVTCGVYMRALDAGGVEEAVSVDPYPDMVVCDVDVVLAQGSRSDALKPGYLALLAGAMAGGRVTWDRFGRSLPLLLEGSEAAFVEELASAQQTRRTVRNATNPSARSAFCYGRTTERALARCLPGDVPRWRLFAEGLRFESRLAVDAGRLDVDDVFEQDDRLDALGAPELAFSLDVDTFVSALKDARFERGNRFLFSLPRHVGTVRLTSVEEDLLREHAEAYLASRAELLGGSEGSGSPESPEGSEN